MASTRVIKIASDKARETLEYRRKDGANPWKLVRYRLKANLQEEDFFA
jgi:hypothetical protein